LGTDAAIEFEGVAPAVVHVGVVGPEKRGGEPIVKGRVLDGIAVFLAVPLEFKGEDSCVVYMGVVRLEGVVADDGVYQFVA
jgi:hypothetical protein